jgi:hypothetical protein
VTVAVWAPGTIYQPGAVVQRRTALAQAVTAISNGGAELGALTDWTTAGAGAWTVSPVAPYAGSYRFNWAGTGSGSIRNATHITVAAGQVLNVTAAINPYSGVLAQGQVSIAFYTAANALISEVDSPASGDVGDGWFVRTASAVAPATTSYARVVLKAGGVGAVVWFDDVQIAYPGGNSVTAGLVFQATQAAAGTSDAVEPVWPTTVGGTVVDNDITWEGVNTSRVIWEATPIMETDTVEPAWPTSVGQRITDGSVSWEALSRRVEDVNCPNSRVVMIIASKVFATDEDIVRFCATARPLDWSSNDDAGFLPTGLQQSNANNMAVLAPYRQNLAAFNASSFQQWQVDPDPAAMAILDTKDGLGSVHQQAAQAIANDLFYLGRLGVRSVGITAGTDNEQAGDIGMPIDPMVQDALRVANANNSRVLATYYPGAGQYWLAFSDYPVAPIGLGGSLASDYVGETVSLQYSTSGGVGPFGPYSITSGALPDGLSMSTAGLITGTRTTEGSFSWQVSRADADGVVATLSDSSDNLPFTISGDVPDAREGDVASGTYANSHGVAPITYAVTDGAFPDGLTLDPDGSWSGTFEPGSFAWEITATDAAGNQAVWPDACEVAEVFTFDLDGVANAGTSSAVGHTIPQTLAPGDTLTLRLVSRAYVAWSGFADDIGPHANSWYGQFNTTEPTNGDLTHYGALPGSANAATALAAAQLAGDIVITGVTGAITFWLGDSPAFDNRGGLSFEYTIT